MALHKRFAAVSMLLVQLVVAINWINLAEGSVSVNDCVSPFAMALNMYTIFSKG